MAKRSLSYTDWYSLLPEQCQTWTFPKSTLNWTNNGFMSAAFYGADGWAKVDDFISHILQ